MTYLPVSLNPGFVLDHSAGEVTDLNVAPTCLHCHGFSMLDFRYHPESYCEVELTRRALDVFLPDLSAYVQTDEDGTVVQLSGVYAVSCGEDGPVGEPRPGWAAVYTGHDGKPRAHCWDCGVEPASTLIVGAVSFRQERTMKQALEAVANRHDRQAWAAVDRAARGVL